jgi:hypothetical protein
LNQFVDFHEIQQGGHATEGDLYTVTNLQTCGFIYSEIAYVQTSEVAAKLAPVNVGPGRVKTGNHDNHTILL